MKAKNSELAIENLLIIACNISTISVTPEFKFPILQNLDLDIDFKILNNSKDISKFKILFAISGNNSKNKKAGYSFSLTSEGNFKINDIENIKKEQIDYYILNSALPILISHIRTYLINVTAYYPFGKYVLPAISLTDLINDKIDIDKKQESKTKSL